METSRSSESILTASILSSGSLRTETVESRGSLTEVSAFTPTLLTETPASSSVETEMLATTLAGATESAGTAVSSIGRTGLSTEMTVTATPTTTEATTQLATGELTSTGTGTPTLTTGTARTALGQTEVTLSTAGVTPSVLLSGTTSVGNISYSAPTFTSRVTEASEETAEWITSQAVRTTTAYRAKCPPGQLPACWICKGKKPAEIVDKRGNPEAQQMDEEDCWLPCKWGVCADVYDVNKRGVLEYNSTYCSSQCYPDQVVDECGEVKGGNQCTNCTGHWDGCIPDKSACPADQLRKQCPSCNSSSEAECAKQLLNETCDSGQDMCMVIEEYNMRGVLVSIRKGCASKSTCNSAGATDTRNCTNSDTISRCSHCYQAESVCGTAPTTASPCSGPPSCFKCSGDDDFECYKSGEYTVCKDDDVCLEVKYNNKFGALTQVVADCSSSFAEYGSVQSAKDFTCPGTIIFPYDGDLRQYTCSLPDRCEVVTEKSNCSNPSPTCRACHQTRNKQTCDDIAYDEVCPDDNYVCVANFTRDQRGTIIGYSRGCVERSLVDVCPTTKDECTSLGNQDMTQPASRCYTCESTVGMCGEITTVAPSTCPQPEQRLACLVCDEKGNTADVLCDQKGTWTPCDGPDVACLEIKKRDPRGSLKRFTRKCTTRATCAKKGYTEQETCIKQNDASETCRSCKTTTECRAEVDLCPPNEVPLCYRCDAMNEAECIQGHRQDSDYDECSKGKCEVLTRTNKLGVTISYSSACAPSSCTSSCVTNTDGSQTCRNCTDFVKCSGTTPPGSVCKDDEVLSCFTCTGSDEQSCKNSDNSGWVSCPHGNCITEFYKNSDGDYQEYRMACGRRKQECPSRKETKRGLAGWVKVKVCEKATRCSCFGDEKRRCNDNGDIYDTPLCPYCPASQTALECDSQIVYKECPSTYCIESIDKDQSNNVISVKKYCSPKLCQPTTDPLKRKHGDVTTETRCSLYNDTLSGKTGQGGGRETPSPTPAPTTLTTYLPTAATPDAIARRYNCSKHETLRCNTCKKKKGRTVCDYYEKCRGIREPICRKDTSGDVYKTKCVESDQCFPSEHISCQPPSCQPKAYKVSVAVTIEATFRPEYGQIGSRQWWLMCLTLMSIVDAFYKSIPGYLGITCGIMKPGSIEAEYFVHFDEPVTNEAGLEVTRATMTGLMERKHVIKINDELVNITGNYVMINSSNNMTMYDFVETCQDQLVCEDGQICDIDNETLIASCRADTSGFSELLPIVVPLSVLTPLAVIMVAALVVIGAKKAREKRKARRSKFVADTMNRYHVSDTGTWSTIQRAFTPDYKSNWRSYIGAGFQGDAREYEWDPDSASDVTVHRNKALAGTTWNFTELEEPNNDGPMTEEEQIDDIVRRARLNDDMPSSDQPSDEFRIPRPALPGRTAQRFPFRMPQFQGLRGLNRPMSFFGSSTEGSR